MKIKTLLFLTLSFLLFSGPCFGANHCKMARQIMNIYIKEVAKPRGLRVAGSGGAMMYDIEGVTLSFISFDALTIDDARKLYVEMVDEFLARVNQNEKIRPYLHSYPFKSSEFDLMIGFEDKQRNIRGDDFVALIFQSSRHKRLCVKGYDRKQEKYYPLHYEPYEESVRIVQESKKCRYQEAREES